MRVRWLLDGGFGDAANVTYLIEMGYDVYTMAHNGKAIQVLLKDVPEDAAMQASAWIKSGPALRRWIQTVTNWVLALTRCA